MKKSKLKPLIKAVLREMYNKPLNETSDTTDDYEIKYDTLIIPDISTDKDSVKITVTFDYDVQAGAPETGQFGAPEHAAQSEGGDVTITGWKIVLVTIESETGQVKEIDNLKTLKPNQILVIKNAAKDYIETNKDTIENQILEKQQL